MSVVIVDYGVGNLGSIPNMLKRLGTPSIVSSDPHVIASATRLILPGVGAFDAGMRRLRELQLESILRDQERAGIPILGLCLGMQLLFEGSAEGSQTGLGWLAGEIVSFRLAEWVPPLPVPHMGWNFVKSRRSHPILDGLDEQARFYFAHSFHAQCKAPADVVAETTYGVPFPSIVARENVVGAQFHPEKSHRFGLQFLRNFLAFT